MKIAMELSALVENAILPEGFEFEDFGGGCFIMPIPDKEDRSKFLEGFAIKLTNGGKSKTIHIVALRGNRARKISVTVGQFAQEIDDAILELS
jgi:hypothetical protein